MVLKTEPSIKPFFFFNFRFNLGFARFLTGLGVLTRPNWLSILDSDRFGPVFKTMKLIKYEYLIFLRTLSISNQTKYGHTYIFGHHIPGNLDIEEEY